MNVFILVMSLVATGFIFSHYIKEAILDYKKGSYWFVGMDVFIGILAMAVAVSAMVLFLIE